MAAKKTTIVDTTSVLAAAGVFLSSPFQLGAFAGGSVLLRRPYDAFGAVAGGFNSDQAGTLDIYQGEFADVSAVAAGVPATGAGDSKMLCDSFVIAAGAANKGVRVAIQAVGPWCVVRYTNGGVDQAKFFLHLDVAE